MNSSRYVLHIGLYTPRPPLAHPVILALPPNLPKLLLDEIHQFFFEKLSVPQLLVTSRPMVATIASGVNNGIVLDVGARGEGSEISIITESQLLESSTFRFETDEGTLDDYLSLLLIQEDPTLMNTLFPYHEPSCQEIMIGLRSIITSLKEGNVIGFESPHFKPIAAVTAPAAEEGEFDVAKVMAEGKSKNQRKGKKKEIEATEDEDIVEIPHPYLADVPPIRIGPIRNRYLEPIFLPSLLSQLAPSDSITAQQLGLEEYEEKETTFAGVQEMMGLLVEKVGESVMRTSIWLGVVVTSTGKVASNKGESLVFLIILLISIRNSFRNCIITIIGAIL